jgi:hypothetical protein
LARAIYSPSCSLASGTYHAESGDHGNVTWVAKQTPNTVTGKQTTAHFNVRYSAYIPVDHIAGPDPCLYRPNLTSTGLPWSLLYKGDALRGTYRTTQSVITIPNAVWDYNFYYNTGPTRNYGSPANGSNANLDSTPQTGDIYNGPYIGADEDQVAGDCYLWNNSGKALTTDMTSYNITYPTTPTQVQVNFFGSGRDPIEPPKPIPGWLAPPISWNMNVVVDDANPTNPTAYVNYNHTCYPAHIVLVNGRQVYYYPPPANNPAIWRHVFSSCPDLVRLLVYRHL